MSDDNTVPPQAPPPPLDPTKVQLHIEELKASSDRQNQNLEGAISLAGQTLKSLQ